MSSVGLIINIGEKIVIVFGLFIIEIDESKLEFSLSDGYEHGVI
jgi:hypothetical protein